MPKATYDKAILNLPDLGLVLVPGGAPQAIPAASVSALEALGCVITPDPIPPATTRKTTAPAPEETPQ